MGQKTVTKQLAKIAQDLWIRWLLGLALIAALALLMLNQLDLRLTLVIVAAIGFTYLLLLGRKTGAVVKAQQELTASTHAISQLTVQALELSQNILSEMRATRETQVVPYVVLSLEVHEQVVQLVLENLGQTVARQIALEWEPMPDAALINGREWANFITGTTPTLAPRQRLVAVLGTYPAVYANKALQPRYQVTVRYRGATDDVQFQGTDILDFNSLAGMESLALQQGQQMIGKLDQIALSLSGKMDQIAQSLDGKMGQIAQSLDGTLRLLHQSHSQIVNQLGDMTHTFETTITATNSTQKHVVNSLEDITKVVAGTMETVNMTQDQLTQGMVAIAANRHEPDKQSPEQAMMLFKLLVKRLDMSWRKMQEWPKNEQSSPNVYLQRQMLQWARDVVAIAPGLPAADVVAERASSVALKLISALDEGAQNAAIPAAVTVNPIMEELTEIARTFPEDEESFLL